MNLNDPFGRVALRRERNYEAFRESLRKGGVTSRRDAEALLERTRRRGLVATLVVIATACSAALLLPDAAVVTLAFAAVVLLWIFTSVRNGSEFLQRYIDETADDPAADGAA